MTAVTREQLVQAIVGRSPWISAGPDAYFCFWCAARLYRETHAPDCLYVQCKHEQRQTDILEAPVEW